MNDLTVVIAPVDCETLWLRREIQRLCKLNASLERTIHEMLTNLPRPAVDGCCPYATLLHLISVRRGGTVYAARIDYVNASHTKGCRAVSEADMLAWKKENSVPDWALAQLGQMSFKKHTNPPTQVWKPTEDDYLREAHRTVTTNNAALAKLCSERFGRTITVAAIKGKLDRLNLNKPRSNTTITIDLLESC